MEEKDSWWTQNKDAFFELFHIPKNIKVVPKILAMNQCSKDKCNDPAQFANPNQFFMYLNYYLRIARRIENAIKENKTSNIKRTTALFYEILTLQFYQKNLTDKGSQIVESIKEKLAELQLRFEHNDGLKVIIN